MNIKEIAKLSGVSVATISRVINNSPNVSDKTREKIKDILKKYDFKSDFSAKRLANKRKRTKSYCLVNRRVVNLTKNREFYSNILDGIKKASPMNNDLHIEVMENFLENPELDGTNGVLLVGSDTTKEDIAFFKNRNIPVVLVDQYIPAVKVDCVISNGYDGSSYAMDYLFSKGFKRIIHVHGFLNHFAFKDRYDGYVESMEKRGFLPKTFEYNDDRMEDMKPLVERILKSGLPDAVFTSNDPIAMKLIATFKEFNIRIPDDVSVIGFDGTVEGEKYNPSLSSLKIPMYEMGSLGMKRLMQIMSGEDIYPVIISLFTKFVKGCSSI